MHEVAFILFFPTLPQSFLSSLIRCAEISICNSSIHTFFRTIVGSHNGNCFGKRFHGISGSSEILHNLGDLHYSFMYPEMIPGFLAKEPFCLLLRDGQPTRYIQLLLFVSLQNCHDTRSHIQKLLFSRCVVSGSLQPQRPQNARPRCLLLLTEIAPS